jgi:hypothetical protein
MSNDMMYDCAIAYEKLTHFQFELKLYNNRSIRDIILIFDPSEFKHLTGLEKLSDKPIFSQLTSRELLKNILDKKITYETISDSKFLLAPINDVSPNNIKYYVTDRINELTYLYNYLHNMKFNNLHIYQWHKNISPNLRPNHSDINADILFEFSTTMTNKFPEETTCAFFVETVKRTEAVGMSIFPTDISYSDDGKIKAEKYTILSAKELNKDTGAFEKLIELSEESLHKALSESLIKDRNLTIKNDIKVLKSKRKAYRQSPTASNEQAYNKRLTIFKNSNIYTPDMLGDVLNRLAAQRDDLSNIDAAPLIEKEIDFIKNTITDLTIKV